MERYYIIETSDYKLLDYSTTNTPFTLNNGYSIFNLGDKKHRILVDIPNFLIHPIDKNNWSVDIIKQVYRLEKRKETIKSILKCGEK